MPALYIDYTELRSCVEAVEVAVLGSLSYKPTVSVDVKQHFNISIDYTELRSCVKVEVAILGSLSGLISLIKLFL